MRQPFLGVLVAAGLIAGSCLAGETAPVGSKQNPIKVHGVEMERFYCKFLRTPDGEEVEYERVGSFGEGPYGNILDLYKVTTKDGKTEWDIYIDMYHEDANSLPQVAPPGLLTLQQYTASKLKGKQRNYIGLSLPSGSQFAPIVTTTASGSPAIARVVPGPSGSDIEVLSEDGQSWALLGKNGNAVTGNAKGYTFLSDFRRGPDDALWLMATFTFPNRDTLFRYDGREWKIVGPADGLQESWGMWSAGIVFGKDKRPFCVKNRQKEGLFVAKLQDNVWAEATIPKHILDIKPPDIVDVDDLQGFAKSNIFLHTKCVTTDGAVWLFWDWSGQEETRISALRIAGTTESDYFGPVDLLSLGSKRIIQSQAVSADEHIALNITDGNYQDGRVYLITSTDGWKTVQTQKTTELQGDTEFDDLRWSPRGDLYACRVSDDNLVELLHLQDQTWTVKASHRQPEESGRVFDARIFFGKDGDPVVVWEDLFR